MKRAALLLSVLGTIAGPLSSQAPPVIVGDFVRIHTGESGIDTYTVVALVADTLVVRDVNAVETRLPFSSIRNLAVHRGYRSAGAAAGSGALVGLGIGAGIGILVGVVSGDDQGQMINFSAGEKAMLAGAVLGGAGAILGALIGSASAGDRWDNVSLAPRISLGDTPTAAMVVRYSATF